MLAISMNFELSFYQCKIFKSKNVKWMNKYVQIEGLQELLVVLQLSIRIDYELEYQIGNRYDNERPEIGEPTDILNHEY